MTETIDAEVLERMRRGVPLRRTAGGAWWFGDEPVTHRGLLRALTCGLDVADNGEPIVRLGQQYCYVTLDDTPLRVVGVDADERGAIWLRLDDDRVVALDPKTLVEDRGAGLRCTVPSMQLGRPMQARFANRAQAELAQWIRWPAEAARPSIECGGVSFEIAEG